MIQWIRVTFYRFAMVARDSGYTTTIVLFTRSTHTHTHTHAKRQSLKRIHCILLPL